MEDKVTKVTEEEGIMTVNLKNGVSQKVLAKTIYTFWKSGRKDCAIQIAEPLIGSAIQQPIGGGK